jgi:hypothetical protein
MGKSRFGHFFAAGVVGGTLSAPTLRIRRAVAEEKIQVLF